MDDSRKRLAKLNVATAILNNGSLFIHLDPRLKEVTVPSWLTDRAQLVLQVGWDMPIPIPDLRVDNHGIYGTLSFSRNPFICDIPWSAIFALVSDDGRGMVWEDNIPSEIIDELEEAQTKPTKVSTLKKVKPALAPKPREPKQRGKTKLPSYLRIIK